MTRRLLFGLVLLFLAVPAAAQPVRTWVSTFGDDLATCERATPCRTFAAAIAAVTAGGEVVALDSGGFSPFTINKSVSIISPPGIHAALAPTAGNGITVSAPGGRVILRGLYVNGLGGAIGIHFNNVATLHVENCVVAGFAASGLGGGTGPNDLKLYVSHSIFRNNANEGIAVGAIGSGKEVGVIESCLLLQNGFAGINIFGNAWFIVRNSVAADCGTGFLVQSTQPDVWADLTVEDCVAVRNGYGLSAFTGVDGVATIRFAGCTVTHNAVRGISIEGLGASGRSLRTSFVDQNFLDLFGSVSGFTPM